MLLLNYNSVNAVRSGGGKRKAASVSAEDEENSREEKKARQVNQLLIEVCPTIHPLLLSATPPVPTHLPHHSLLPYTLYCTPYTLFCTFSPLSQASRKGDLGACIQAIRDGAEVGFQSCGLSPLFYAAFYGHSIII